jgi:hypothetical protein
MCDAVEENIFVFLYIREQIFQLRLRLKDFIKQSLLARSRLFQ